MFQILKVNTCYKVEKVAQLCLTLCDPMDCSYKASSRYMQNKSIAVEIKGQIHTMGSIST